ncbi:MAG: hypothetical protein NBV63_02180 [Candidatus Pacebacteria bacterium]|nr:hypothetical protein [Candidatus Paceibacterota bacterium]
MKKELLATAVVVGFASLFFAADAEASDLIKFITGASGVSVNPLPDGAVSAKIGVCTAVFQPQDGGHVKIFSFNEGDAFASSNTGLTEEHLLKLKHELGNPKMTNADLVSALEHTKPKIAVQVIQFLKESSDCNVKSPLTS